MLFKLRGVEEDEADEVRALLAEHDVDFYETTNGRWGLGFAAIWLHSDAQFEQGKALIAEYQQQRYVQARADYEALCVKGEQLTLWDMFKLKPWQMLLVLLAVVIVGMFSLSPFLLL